MPSWSSVAVQQSRPAADFSSHTSPSSADTTSVQSVYGEVNTETSDQDSSSLTVEFKDSQTLRYKYNNNYYVTVNYDHDNVLTCIYSNIIINKLGVYYYIVEIKFIIAINKMRKAIKCKRGMLNHVVQLEENY